MVIASITTTGKIGLLAVAGTFIAFSLIVAMVVPKRRPEFPGRRLRLFILVTAALFAAQLATVWWVAETQEVEAAEHGEPAETEPAETQPDGDAAAGNGAGGDGACRDGDRERRDRDRTGRDGSR